MLQVGPAFMTVMYCFIHLIICIWRLWVLQNSPMSSGSAQRNERKHKFTSNEETSSFCTAATYTPLQQLFWSDNWSYGGDKFSKQEQEVPQTVLIMVKFCSDTVMLSDTK